MVSAKTHYKDLICYVVMFISFNELPISLIFRQRTSNIVSLKQHLAHSLHTNELKAVTQWI